MPLGAFISGGFNMYNQQQANKASAREAQKDRDFQERMAKTSYQNMVKDLEAAGLNKALAYGNTPSKVSGSTASQGAATMPEADFAGAMNKRAQTKLAEAQVNTALAQEELTRNNADKVKTEIASILAKLPEEIKLMQSTTARNDADSVSNPWKWGYEAYNQSKKLVEPINLGASSAWDAYQKYAVEPTQKALDGVSDWFSSLYNKGKDAAVKLYNKAEEAYIKKHVERKK